jgi:hypothetical protein
VLWENDGLIPEGIYDGTDLIVLQPGDSHLVPTVAAPEGDLGAIAAYGKAYEDGDI